MKRVEPKAVKESSWVRNPIDRFIKAGLEELDLNHAPAADLGRVDQARHLRPDRPAAHRPKRSRRFWPIARPDAYERVVDRLLASPQYGERWGQHWLDLAHYADTNGFELDAEKPDAWRYRDWVVRSLNAICPTIASWCSSWPATTSSPAITTPWSRPDSAAAALAKWSAAT